MTDNQKLATIIDANDPVIKEGKADKAKRLLYGLFAFVKSTPAQKARALAAIITEMGGVA